MPFPTFFNLPAEKRARILRAINNEFARVPFEEVSINRIVQQAEIPRGSFYQYFEDKKDMLEYVLADYRQVVSQAALDSLKKHQGDIFRMFTDLFEFTVAFVAHGPAHAFLRNLLSDVRINIGFYTSLLEKGRNPKRIDEMAAQVDMRMLDIRSADDFRRMLGVLLPLTCDAIAHVFFDISKYEEIRADYLGKLALLQRGFLKEKETCP